MPHSFVASVAAVTMSEKVSVGSIVGRVRLVEDSANNELPSVVTRLASSTDPLVAVAGESEPQHAAQGEPAQTAVFVVDLG
jgi:hypothetical protein